MHSRNGGASSSRLIHAQPPHSSHRTGDEVEVVGAEVVLVEDLGPQHEGVGAVETLAPAVERAGEAATGPAALDELHAAVAAGVVERADVVVV